MRFGYRRQAGLTLVELMVATTLSLVLLAGVLLVFTSNKATYRLQNGLGTLQENGRYALRQITADLQLAGFGGCLSPHLDPRVVVLASSPPSYITDFADGEFFDGRDDQTSTHTFGGVNMSTGPDYDGDGAGDGLGTDAIEIRGPLRSNVSYVTGEIPTTGTVDVLGTGSGFAANEYLMISDCTGADIFRATAVGTGSGNTQVSHAASLNSQAALSRRFGADSLVMEFATHTYFVGQTSRNDQSGRPVFALYRFDGANSTELVDGVEDLQIEYALDTDGNGTVDRYADDPGTVASWNDVMAVRVSLLINSVEDASEVLAPYNFRGVQYTPAANDFRLRQEFSSLVSVRNSVL